MAAKKPKAKTPPTDWVLGRRGAPDIDLVEELRKLAGDLVLLSDGVGHADKRLLVVARIVCSTSQALERGDAGTLAALEEVARKYLQRVGPAPANFPGAPPDQGDLWGLDGPRAAAHLRATFDGLRKNGHSDEEIASWLVTEIASSPVLADRCAKLEWPAPPKLLQGVTKAIKGAKHGEDAARAALRALGHPRAKNVFAAAAMKRLRSKPES